MSQTIELIIISVIFMSIIFIFYFAKNGKEESSEISAKR